jgi:NADPH:quinone reductase-like Zn-dependent oxidoreductase
VLAARAVRALEPGSDDPLSALEVADAPAAEAPPGWVRVTVAAAALNRHDLWSLRGVGLPVERLPMVLGCDAAGTLDDGSEVIVHAVVSDEDFRGDETLDPRRRSPGPSAVARAATRSRAGSTGRAGSGRPPPR